MPDKYDLATYLCNLHFLMEAQRQMALQPSLTITADYERGWAQLKDAITKEQQDETRKQ